MYIKAFHTVPKKLPKWPENESSCKIWSSLHQKREKTSQNSVTHEYALGYEVIISINKRKQKSDAQPLTIADEFAPNLRREKNKEKEKENINVYFIFILFLKK